MKITENKDNKVSGLFEVIIDKFVPKDKGIEDLLPYKKMLKDGTLVTNEDTFQAFFKIKTTDLTSLAEDGYRRMVNKFTYLNRVYLEPYKIYSLTYPTENHEQLDYWKLRVKEAKKAVYENTSEYREQYLKWNLKLAYDNYKKVKDIRTLPEQTFILAVYGDTQKALNNNSALIKQVGGKELGLERVTGKDLENVITKLLNPNSVIR